MKVVDAIRISDGKDVAIMKLRRRSYEGEIYRHLVDPQRLGGDDRHIVPLLDTFQDEREPDLEFFVIPFLAKFDIPPFDTVYEVVDLFKQMLEVCVLN